jgi:hypothetical protein
MRRGFRAVVLVAAAGLLGLASGCGGGDDGSGSTTKTIAGQTITVPTVTQSTTASTPATSGATTVPPTITLPSGARIQTSALTPFRDCLRRHGVEPLPLNSPPPRLGDLTPERIAQLRAQFQARTACAHLLPPELRRAVERYGREIQQRRQRAG